MELYTLQIDVNEQELSFTNELDLYSGDQGIDYVQFTFKDDRWDGFSERFAVFSRFKKDGYKIPLDENGKAEVPAEVMQEKGYLFIGLFATDGVDTVQTSSVLQYRLGQGAINKELLTPTNDIYEQFITDLNEYHEAMENLSNLTATAETLPAGSDATASFDDGVLELGIPKGDIGETGNGIASIKETSTAGAVHTYTITYTNGQTTTFDVTDGEVTEAMLGETLQDYVSKDEVSGCIDFEQYTETTIINNTPVFTVGAMPQNGVAIPSYTAFNYTQKIAVQPGDIIQAETPGGGYAYMRWVCAYNGDIAEESKGNADDSQSYTVPEGIDGVVITVRISGNTYNVRITRKTTQQVSNIVKTPMGYMLEAGNLDDGEMLTLPYHNVKNDNIYMFNANITNFSSISFKKGPPQNSIAVDNTNITLTNDQTSFTIPHGLTISHDISLMICNETSTYLSLIRLSSAGQTFDYTTTRRFIMDENNPIITSSGSSLTECTLSWVSKNVNAPIWIFGDSYLSWYSVRWTYYLAQDGYTKSCLLNGYAGEGSTNAYNALISLLNITVPKQVVWCMGMNDGDSSSEVNSSWYSNYLKVIELSKKYGFELILYTVPTTPAINNNFKNTIVRNSGYRYIEADKAVRIDNVGNWVPGALESDDVHPTAIGAVILYNRVLADLPEIMSNY